MPVYLVSVVECGDLKRPLTHMIQTGHSDVVSLTYDAGSSGCPKWSDYLPDLPKKYCHLLLPLAGDSQLGA